MKPDRPRSAPTHGAGKPVYYWYGDETFLLEREVKRFCANAVPADVADFNLDILYAGDRSGQEIVAVAQTLPMFAERRIVVVRRSEGLTDNDYEVLTGYLRDPSPTTCLLLIGKKPDMRRKFFQELKSAGELVEFKTPYENQLPAFIVTEASHLGMRIDPEAVELLLSLSGTNLQELSSQLEKLAGYVGKGTTITLEAVKEIASDTRADSIFDLANALGHRQLGTALRKLQTVLRDGQAPLSIVGMLARHFRQLWQIRESMARKVPRSELARAIGLKTEYFLPGLVKQAENFTLAEFRRTFEHLYETDIAIKSSRLKPSFLLERFVMAVCSVQRQL